METQSLSSLLNQTQSYPRPETPDEMQALMALLRPQFNHMARILVNASPDGFDEGCRQILSAYEQPSSPFFEPALGVDVQVKHALCQAVRRQPEASEDLFNRACDIFAAPHPSAAPRPKGP